MTEALNALVGEWTFEARHPAYPGVVVHGRATFEWLEGDRFLLQRSRSDHPDFPDSLGVIGEFDDGLALHYYDSRGVHRVYEMGVTGEVWRMSRHAPGSSQRFTGTYADRGDTISGLWQLSRDGTIWEDDLEIVFRRA
jgi:hypothetical protein